MICSLYKYASNIGLCTSVMSLLLSMVSTDKGPWSEAPRVVHADDFGRAVDADSAAVAAYKREEEERQRRSASMLRRQ